MERIIQFDLTFPELHALIDALQTIEKKKSIRTLAEIGMSKFLISAVNNKQITVRLNIIHTQTQEELDI